VDTPEQEQRLHRLVQAQIPGAAVRIVHDKALILAAAAVDHGIALISGTGSVAWGRAIDGRTARAGGWGYLLGDEGSGYAVGRRAVRHTLGQADRGLRPDVLAQQLAADCGLQDPGQLLDHFYANPEPGTGPGIPGWSSSWPATATPSAWPSSPTRPPR
jgi:glucosamine kinase